MSSGDYDNPDPATKATADAVMADPQVNALFNRPYRVDRTKKIPYLAGYSLDGSIYYIDRDMPDGFWYEKNGTKQYITTDEFLVLHERVEKSLIDAIDSGNTRVYIILPHTGIDADDPYLPTHGVATYIETTAVKIMWGQAILDAYNKFMTQQVARAEAEKLDDDVPIDLDLTPYVPSEGPPDDKEARVIKTSWAAQGYERPGVDWGKI